MHDGRYYLDVMGVEGETTYLLLTCPKCYHEDFGIERPTIVELDTCPHCRVEMVPERVPDGCFMVAGERQWPLPTFEIASNPMIDAKKVVPRFAAMMRAKRSGTLIVRKERRESERNMADGA